MNFASPEPHDPATILQIQNYAIHAPLIP